MYLTHLVFAILVAAAIAEVGSTTTLENETHTDAWKTVSQNETFYLMYRSYEYDAGTGGTGKCVSVKLCDKNDTTRTATSRLMYRDAQTTQLMGVTARVTMARSWNSSVDDIIRLGNADDCTAPANAATAEYRLVYSDYTTCDVMVVYGTLEPKCELWIKDGKQQHFDGNPLNANNDTLKARSSEDDSSIKKNITRCEEEYNKLCQVKYQIYDKLICSSPGAN
uniref:Putative salivary lipocalin n=1 Tax=Ixodes ricinus TaxID=34613 RepID=A0A6B0V5P8_IXORI